VVGYAALKDDYLEHFAGYWQDPKPAPKPYQNQTRAIRWRHYRNVPDRGPFGVKQVGDPASRLMQVCYGSFARSLAMMNSSTALNSSIGRKIFSVARSFPPKKSFMVGVDLSE